jgi:outer membrane receptor protein involved in Fe transport
MNSMKLCAVAAAAASLCSLARAADPAPSTPPAADLGAVTVTGTASKLDSARNQLSPDTGSTLYRFNKQDIESLPLGESTPLNQVLLQSPGVVQDSFGALHMRGDHANLQYRINGILIPEAISGFGQILDTRIAGQVNVITGALPAQYGYRTAGVIDIKTPTAQAGVTGSTGVTLGSRGDRELAGDVLGASGDWTYFFTGSWLQSNIGVENPTPDFNAIHDQTKQAKGFAYLSRVLDSSSRVSFMAGSTENRFQIPNVPGQTPSFALDGVGSVDSATLDARQREANRFEVLTYQANPNDRLNYQVSLTHRYTDVHYTPDAVGDLVFNGIAATILRKNDAIGLQGDASYALNDNHTLRTGVFVQRERFDVNNSSLVFPADADGNQTSTTPMTIVDNTSIKGRLFGIYLQDEWQVTKALVVNYGVRYDRVNTVVDETQISPRLGLVYDVTPRTRVHAGYARYFTPPPTEKIDTTSVAKFLGTTNALPSDANTAVSSERSHYFDAGISHQVTPELTVSLDGYWRKVKNLQDEGQFGNALVFSAFNYAKGDIGGAEVSAVYKGKQFNAYANVGLTRARGTQIVTGQFNFDPDELDYIANHWVHLDHEQTVSGSAGVSWRWGATTWGADLLYGSGLRRGFANTEHLPGYTQVNASVAHTFGKVDLRLAVINVFDHVYQIRDGSGIGVGAPQFGPRRGVFTNATWHF